VAGLSVIPKYPVEWWKFIRAPATYVETARAPEQRDTLEPWAAFVIGLGISVAFAAYEARRWQGAVDKETEQLFLLLVAALNFAIVHGVCRIFGGRSPARDMGAAFEYLYGFLVPAMVALMSILMAVAELFPGINCRLAIDTFNCDFVPTTTNWVLVSSIQTIFIVLGVYVLAVFNLTISRIHKLETWKVAVAQAVGLAILFVVGSLVYRLAHVMATRFKELTSALTG